jgi:hypothetical protein
LFPGRFSKIPSQRVWLVLSGLVTVSTAVLYLSVASSRLTNANYGSDGGDLLASVLTLGIPHPSGYPTYVLLGSLFQLLPISTPVFRGVLESLIPAALGAGLLTAWVGFVLRPGSPATLIAAALTGISWGIAPLIFSQADIVEVHGLQSLIVVLVLWWLTLNLDFRPGIPPQWLLGIAFLIGLGIGNHLTIILFLPVVILTLMVVIRSSGSWRLVLAQMALVLAGMLVYLYLPMRAQAYPAINWGNPQTWSGFFWEVSADPYRGLFMSANSSVIVERLRSIASLLLDQFGALGLLAGVIGAIQFSLRVRWQRWILAWIFIAYLVFAIAYNTADSASYLIPAFMVFAIWIGLAVPVLWKLNWKQLPVGGLLVAVLAASILIRIPATRSRLDPRLQDQPARYAEQFLKDAPKSAIVYTSTDQDSFPLWYYHFGLKERPDLRIIVLPLTQFAWYQQTLVQIYPGLKFPPIYPHDLPNADWGKQITLLNPQLAVCNTRLSSDSEFGVAYQCSSP